MESRLSTLSDDDHCRSCGGSLAAGTTAWFEPEADRWTCRSCRPIAADGSSELSVADPLGNVRDPGVLILHGRSAPTARGTVDHVVVASSGVWVVDSKYHGGKVVLREGTEPSDRPLLMVGKHNVTPMVENLRWQTEAVRAALTPIGFDDVPVVGVLCFTGADWGWFAKPIRMGGLLVTWPEHLLAGIRGRTVIGPHEIDFIGQQLGSYLVVKP